MSKSGVFSGPYFLLSGLNTEKYGPNPVSTGKVVTLSYFVHYDTFITKCGRYYLQNLTGVIKCVGKLNNLSQLRELEKSYENIPADNAS